MGVKTDFAFLRRKAKDRATLRNLSIIEKDWEEVRKKGKTIKSKSLILLKLGNLNVWLRRNSASSSVDTYLEVFQHQNHMQHPDFLGKKDFVVVDAGANEGYYTLGMKQNNPDLKIIAIEPVKETFALLKKNFSSNRLKGVVLVNKALTEKEGKIRFEVVPEVTVIGARNIGMQPRPWLDKKRIKEVSVESTTLPALCKKLKIQQIDILKLDVEGSELDILKSSEPILGSIRKIVIEWHSEELKKKCTGFLQANGFRLTMDRQEEGRCGDIYFINEKCAKN